MLKKWCPVTPTQVLNLAEQVDECSFDEDFPSWQPTSDKLGPIFGKQLTTAQQTDLSDLIRCF